MSVAELLTKQRELRTLVIDLERVPGWARSYQSRVNFIGKDMWETPPRTCCWSAKWAGEKPVEFASVWDQDDDYLAERSFQLFDDADIALTFYGKGADIPWLEAQWLKRGMGTPSSYHHIDLYKTAKRFHLESNSLDYFAKFLGVQAKVDKWDFRVGDAAIAGDPKAQARVKRYNIGDIRTTEACYWAALPYIKPHPHIAPARYMDQMCCPRCASTDVHRCGLYTPGTYTYAEYRCNVDHGTFKAEFHHRGPSVRAL